jgi:signal-transduction protein with cAMP-binding, CBS, and nucleotidyltransferase domain
LIVDAVRFLALAHLERHAWIPHSTVDRIGWLEKREVLQAGEAAALRDAFENLTALRLEQQLTRPSDSDNQSANVVDLLALNSNQRWMLRKHLQSLESLRD